MFDNLRRDAEEGKRALNDKVYISRLSPFPSR